MSICQLIFTHLNPQRYPKQPKVCTWVPLNFEILPSTSSWLLGSNPTPMAWETMQEWVHHLAWCLHTHTHKGSIELRAWNSQPSEPFIYWGLKSYRSTFNDISLCKKKKYSPWKKAQKALQPIKKKWATEKKHYGAFKSTHYDPCIIEPYIGYFSVINKLHSRN